MEKSLFLAELCIVFGFLDTVSGFPIDFPSLGAGEPNPLWLTNYSLTIVGFFITVIGVVFGCICCRNGKGFKEFSNSSASLAVSRPEGFVNPTSNSELTIFPPAGANSNQICRFEPLPDIKPQAPNLRPAAFSYSEREISSQDWFSEPYNCFPRNQLKYVQEYGRGWFGRVVEGEAQSITSKEKLSKVMVKILHEDATPTDQMYFLHEVKFYRDLNHPNILRLLGRCLETEPFLIILEHYPNGDLKSFLSQNLASARALVEQGVTLQMCSNITKGLQFMHENKFIHTDLAARNCLVGPDLTVKIGDYGNSIEIFKSDYYCAGSVALPVRWCAPESLKCTDVTIETREVTPPANIWSLAVVFWEICEFCKLPYAELNDDQVIVRVLGEKNYFLEKPNMFCLHKDELYHLMKLCWNSPLQRPTAKQISVILDNLISSDKATRKDVQSDLKLISQDFEQRWKNFKPNYIPKKDNAVDVDYSANCSIISSKLKNAKVVDSSLVDSPLGIFMSDVSAGQESQRFCLKSDKEKPDRVEEVLPTEEIMIEENSDGILKEKMIFEHSVLSQKLKGDAPDVDSWLKGVEINNEEDESFVRKISEAIRDLDATLALEKTSSSEETSGKSSHQNSPGKDMRQSGETIIDFKLGSDTSSFMNFTQKSFELTSLQNTEQPQSLDFTDPFLMTKKNELDECYGPSSLIVPLIENTKSNLNIKNDVFDESLKENDSLVWNQSRNSSDTDDENWRKRIERGEISEKVKEKSKSIASLMILTHIDPSDDSDIDIDKPFDKGSYRNSFLRSGSFAKSSLSSNNFGSESDITYAVLEDDFKESLKKLSNDHKEHGHFDSLGMILPVSARRENVWENFFKASDAVGECTHESKITTTTDVNKTKDESGGEVSNVSPVKMHKNFNSESSDNFLGNVASEKLNDNNLLQKVIGSISPTETPGVSMGNNILLGKNSNCDSITCNTASGNSSDDNSSQLKEISVQNSNTLKNKINGLSSLGDIGKNCLNAVSDTNPEIEISEVRNNSEADSQLNEVLCDEVGAGNIGSENTWDSSSSIEIQSVGTSCPQSEFEDVKKTINAIESSESNPHRNLVVIPEIKMTEAEEEETNVPEEVFEPFLSRCKPFRFVLKEKDFIPEITVTEEPEEEFVSEEEEKFEFMSPIAKNFKFFFKENEEVNVDEKKKTDDEKSGLEKADDLDQKPAVSLLGSSIFLNDVKDKIDSSGSSNVIIGACEDFTLDYFKGLKTTSEDISVESGEVAEREEKLQKIIEDLKNKEPNLDVWDKHLENAFTQLNDSDFNDISFKSFSEIDNQPLAKEEQNQNEGSDNFIECSVKTIADFIESEKIHTEKLEEPIHINHLTNLTGMGSEEEYDNFKLRTPDDERSSDSGFRDKGSLSESVEDACEGKYNLEDIEAELEEAYVKGAFGNCEVEKGKDSNKDCSKNCTNFEYEESKFYEDSNRNEEDFSDIDGEIEFWQSKDSTDYYPQISEFNPICSQGWYLHPPDESILNFNRNVDEDLVNALRNELRENLPVQARSFEKSVDDFYEGEIDNARKELNIHYIPDYGQPLSPIVEEQDDVPSEISRKNVKNGLLDESNLNKVRRSIINLMESVKSIDTNTFREYLDYMIENEGRDLDEVEDVEERILEGKEEDVNSPLLILKKDDSKNIETKAFVEDIKNALGIDFISPTESVSSDADQSGHAVLVEDLDLGSTSKIEEVKAEDDILVVNIDTNEVTLLESPKPKSFMAFLDTHQRKDDFLEVITDNSENEGLIFTPEMLSPDRERSFSEISKSSNGTRTGDALSDITLSSPDLVPDCFSTSVHEIMKNNEASEIIKELEDSGIIIESEAFASIPNSTEANVTSPFNISKRSKVQNELFLPAEKKNASDTSEDTSDLQRNLVNEKEDFSEASEKVSALDCKSEDNELYEMSTSFMGDDDDDDENDESYPGLRDSNQKKPTPHTIDQKSNKGAEADDSYIPDWESESSGGEEEASSSSGEFIWKDGEKESKVKVIQASDCDSENMNEKCQSSENAVATSLKEDSSKEKNDDGGEEEEEEEDEDNDNESSTGSSASVTDFVPSAWNSQATPSKPALKSPDKKVDNQQKKSVWFKKQKYHCVYEYPREPSDNEDADISPYNPFSFEKNTSETPNKHFTFGVNTVGLPNKHFPYGISNVINYSSYADWDVMDEDGDLSLTDTDSDNGLGKSESTAAKESDFNFYNLSPFDYDFNNAGDESEFFVSSSSRPFQGGPSGQSFPGNKQSTLFNYSNEPNSGNSEMTDFITPDSGLEDSANVTPLDKKLNLNHENILLHVGNNSEDSKPGIINILDNLKFNFSPEIVEIDVKKVDLETFGKNTNTNGNGLFAPSSNSSSILSSSGLGQLRHARNKLKLDLPHNHNAELGAVISKKNQQNSVKL